MTSRAAPGRLELTAMLAGIMATGAIGIDLMLPAFSAIRQGFGLPADSTATAAIVTAYFVGMAVGQPVFGALSDRHGRKRALIWGLFLYVVAATLAALSPSLIVLLAARLLWGLGASGPRVVVVAIVRDLYEGTAMAQAMSYVMAVFVLVPVMAPALGAAVLSVAGWRSVFGVCVVFALVLLVWIRRLPETLDPANRRDLRLDRFLEATRTVIRNRSTMACTAAMTLLFGCFTSYLASSELIIGGILDRRPMFPLVFGLLAGVMGVAMVGNGAIVRRFGLRRMSTLSLSAYAGWAWIVAIGAVATGGTPTVTGFVIGIAPLLALHALTFPNLNSAAMQPMGAVAGTASAVIGTVTTASGALIGSLIDRSIVGTVTPLAVAFAVSGTLAMVVTMWGSADPSTVAAGAAPTEA